jgi:hypothetical protein
VERRRQRQMCIRDRFSIHLFAGLFFEIVKQIALLR